MFQAIPTSATNLLFTSPGAAPRCNMAHTLCASRLIATGSVIFHPLCLRLAMNCRSYHATISGEIPTSGGGGACTVDGDACTVVAGGAGAGALVDAGAGGGAAFIVGVGLGAGAGVGRESLPGHARCPNQTAAPTAMPTSATMAAMTHVLRQVWGSPSIGSVSSDHASAVADSEVGEIDVPSVAAGPASVGAQFGRPVVVGSGPASEEPDGGEAGTLRQRARTLSGSRHVPAVHGKIIVCSPKNGRFRRWMSTRCCRPASGAAAAGGRAGDAVVA